MTNELIRERLWTYAYALRGAAEANRQRASDDMELQGLVAVADMVAADLDGIAALVGEGEEKHGAMMVHT
jgi:hypothetical protein